MKIQFFGNQTFLIDGKNAKAGLNPTADIESDIALINQPSFDTPKDIVAKKVLSLPGEFEASGVLINALPTDGHTNTVFKFDMDDIVCAHLGNLKDLPLSKFYEELGENVDILFLPLSEDIKGKQAKEIFEKVSPRVTFVCGDQALFPEAIEKCGAKVLEESSIKMTRSQFSDDAMEVYILSV